MTPVYAIVGDEPFLQGEALRAVVREMPGDVQRVDLDGDSASLHDVLDELRSYSMFGGYKLVVIRAADDFLSKHREKLEEYVAKPSDGGSLVLRLDSLPKNQRIYKAIDKAGKVIACEAPKESTLPGWITQRARHHHTTIDPEAAERLAHLIGPDLGRLDSELGKLSLMTDGRIRVDDVSGTVAFQREQQMWEMTDALSLGEPSEAVRRWRHLITTDPSAEFRAVTWLAIWLEKANKALLLKQQKLNAFAIAKELKIWPAQNAEKLLTTVEKLGARRLRDAVDRLIDIDRKNKSGLGEPATNVEQFLLTLG